MFLIGTMAHAVDFFDGPRARKTMHAQVKRLFEDGKFAELDSMADQIRTTKSRYPPDGGWKLAAFYGSLDLNNKYPEWVFTKYISAAEKWRSTNSKSVTAQVVLANTWFNYAWKARGTALALQLLELFDPRPLLQCLKGKYETPPNPNRRKGAEDRQQSGDRERNIGHPEGEEHSRVPKGPTRK